MVSIEKLKMLLANITVRIVVDGNKIVFVTDQGGRLELNIVHDTNGRIIHAGVPLFDKVFNYTPDTVLLDRLTWNKSGTEMWAVGGQKRILRDTEVAAELLREWGPRGV